LNLDQVFIFY